jgi:hypothetical protein
MYDTDYNNEIRHRVNRIAKDSIIDEKKKNIYENPRGMHSVSANGAASAFQNLHLLNKTMKGKGNEYEEIEDAKRVTLEEAMGSGKGKVETKYIKQMPILGGSNMEMIKAGDPREQIKIEGGNVPANTYSRLVKTQITGGKKKSVAAQALADKIKEGAGWANAIKEVEGAGVPKPSTKSTARTDKIKEIMKEHKMKMTEASSYIKKNNIPY